MSRPLPDVTDAEFAPFWSGAALGELRIVFCSSCDTPRWPPRPICPHCQSFDFAWRPVRAAGHLYTWTNVEHKTTPGIDPPYTVGLVELDAHPVVRLLGQIRTATPAALRVGMPVVAAFDRITDEVTLVNWVVAAADEEETNGL